MKRSPLSRFHRSRAWFTDIVAISVGVCVRNGGRNGERESLTDTDIVHCPRFCPYLQVPALATADPPLKYPALGRQDSVRVLERLVCKFVDEDGLDQSLRPSKPNMGESQRWFTPTSGRVVLERELAKLLGRGGWNGRGKRTVERSGHVVTCYLLLGRHTVLVPVWVAIPLAGRGCRGRLRTWVQKG